MMACDECQRVFDAETEAHIRYESATDEEFIACPACKCEELSYASPCEVCGEHFHPAELEDGMCADCLPETIVCVKCHEEVYEDEVTEGLCAACQRKAKRLFDTMFTDHEIAYIRSMFDAERLTA